MAWIHAKTAKTKRWPPMSDAQYIERYKSRCQVDQNGCWLFHGFIHPTGYALTSYRGKQTRAHRAMYMAAKGPIPDGMHVCHTCDVRHCINPDHLWIGTRSDNMRDMHAKYRGPQQTKTHCPRGHPYDEENTYLTPEGFRNCKMCSRIRQRMKNLGWTREQAESLPVTPKGHRPVNPRPSEPSL